MKLVKSHERLVKINGRSYWVYVDELRLSGLYIANDKVIHFVVHLIGDTRSLSLIP